MKENIHFDKPRIAFVSPLPPGEYGVPVYSARTVEALARYVTVDVISRAELPYEVLRSVHGIIDTDEPRALDNYDAAFFVHGNNVHHMEVMKFAELTRRGIGIFHDAQQLDFARMYIGDGGVIEIASHYLGRQVEESDLHAWHRDRASMPIPLLDPAATLPHSAVVHSPLQKIHHERHYHQDVHYVPVAIQHKFMAKQLARDSVMRAKLRCGIDEKQYNLGTFGFVHAEKLPDVYLSAVRHLHDWGCPVQFWFVGAIGESVKGDIAQKAASLGLSDYVNFSGRVTESQYCDYLLGLDLAFQFRRPYFGQLSGALLDCAAAGLRVISNASLASAIEAPGYVRPIKDHFTSIDIAEAASQIMKDCDLECRAHDDWEPYVNLHSFDNYARKLLAIAELTVAIYEQN